MDRYGLAFFMAVCIMLMILALIAGGAFFADKALQKRADKFFKLYTAENDKRMEYYQKWFWASHKSEVLERENELLREKLKKYQLLQYVMENPSLKDKEEVCINGCRIKFK